MILAHLNTYVLLRWVWSVLWLKMTKKRLLLFNFSDKWRNINWLFSKKTLKNRNKFTFTWKKRNENGDIPVHPGFNYIKKRRGNVFVYSCNFSGSNIISWKYRNITTSIIKVVRFLLSTEIIPLCLRIMGQGPELSRTVATFILQKVLLDDTGLYDSFQNFYKTFLWI